jgi:predicted methyltransferase
MRIQDFAVLLAVPFLGCSSAAPAPKSPAPEAPAPAVTGLDAALVGAQRTEMERARDVYRHPRETLEFLGVRADTKVIELSASGGWYTAILAPLLRDKGALTVTSSDPNGPPDSEGTKSAKTLAERFSKDPATFGKVQTIVADWKGDVSLGPDGSADVVLTFRNLHGWIRDGLLDKVLSASMRVLKHGGTLGVEEHRAPAGVASDPKVIGDTGYVPESYVIEVAQKAGFKLAGKSEINANPKDTKDYPKGVWTLPPSLRLGDVDKGKYTAIGESDRMTLRFVKP